MSIEHPALIGFIEGITSKAVDLLLDRLDHKANSEAKQNYKALYSSPELRDNGVTMACYVNDKMGADLLSSLEHPPFWARFKRVFTKFNQSGYVQPTIVRVKGMRGRKNQPENSVHAEYIHRLLLSAAVDSSVTRMLDSASPFFVHFFSGNDMLSSAFAWESAVIQDSLFPMAAHPGRVSALMLVPARARTCDQGRILCKHLAGSLNSPRFNSPWSYLALIDGEAFEEDGCSRFVAQVATSLNKISNHATDTHFIRDFRGIVTFAYAACLVKDLTNKWSNLLDRALDKNISEQTIGETKRVCGTAIKGGVDLKSVTRVHCIIASENASYPHRDLIGLLEARFPAPCKIEISHVEATFPDVVSILLMLELAPGEVQFVSDIAAPYLNGKPTAEDGHYFWRELIGNNDRIVGDFLSAFSPKLSHRKAAGALLSGVDLLAPFKLTIREMKDVSDLLGAKSALAPGAQGTTPVQ